MRDIETRSDIEKLIQSFYEKALPDDVIGFIFTDVARLNLEHHLPIITDFWENVLFSTGVYSRNAMAPHFNLNTRIKFHPQHFERWIKLFTETVQENFAGARADLAIARAKSIAAIMQLKLSEANKLKIQ